MAPLDRAALAGRRVLELGCGNGSLLVHTAAWEPAALVGVDLGESVSSARANMATQPNPRWQVEQADLTTYRSGEDFDVVYCIGVIHHLKQPKEGFDALVRNTRPGGRFHGWVYAHEGNALIRILLEPIRRLACRLPWWVNKYLVATPLVVPYFLYAKTLHLLHLFAPSVADRLLGWLPLYRYSLWIAQRGFLFFRHVAFDQLVTPQTVYIRRSQIEAWLAEHPSVERGSGYVIDRNGNSWKFGGRAVGIA
jgi:SAM-dependent methyltransferase